MFCYHSLYNVFISTYSLFQMQIIYQRLNNIIYIMYINIYIIFHKGAGSDWRCIERKLNAVPFDVQVLTKIEDTLPKNFSFEWFSRYLNKLECNREERYVRNS